MQTKKEITLTTEFPHEIVHMTWKIKDFLTLCESKPSESYPKFFSPMFGIINGPQFNLVLCPKGINVQAKGNFSLLIALRSMGEDPGWMVTNTGGFGSSTFMNIWNKLFVMKVRAKFEFILLDSSGCEYKVLSKYTCWM